MSYTLQNIVTRNPHHITSRLTNGDEAAVLLSGPSSPVREKEETWLSKGHKHSEGDTELSQCKTASMQPDGGQEPESRSGNNGESSSLWPALSMSLPT